MKSIFILISIVSLFGCTTGNKPVLGQQTKLDNRCEKVLKVSEDWRKLGEMPVDSVLILKDNDPSQVIGKCGCHEVIMCLGIEYCFSYMCPDGEILSGWD